MLCTWSILELLFLFLLGWVNITSALSRFCLDHIHVYFCLYSILEGVYYFSGVAFWTQTGERQTAWIRLRYLQSVLKKDIRFFDNEAKDANIISHISSDAILVQDAIGDKVYTDFTLLI